MTSSIDSPSVRIITVSRNKSPSMKEKQVFLLFFPIVLFGLLSKSLDNLMDCSKFQTVRNYFQFVSSLRFIVFILVIAVLVQFIEIFLKKYVVALYNSLGVYLPLITTNCCVLAVTILVVDDYGADVATLGFAAAYVEALVCAVGAGVGFMLAMVMFSGVRKRVEACDPPAPFKGLPITLIAAAITSLSFMGFGGLVENLFNVTL